MDETISLALAIEEMLDSTDPATRMFDESAIRTLLDSPELKEWLKKMDGMALLPKKTMNSESPDAAPHESHVFGERFCQRCGYAKDSATAKYRCRGENINTAAPPKARFFADSLRQHCLAPGKAHPPETCGCLFCHCAKLLEHWVEPPPSDAAPVACEKPLLMAGDAEYLRGLSVGGSHLVSTKWLCDFAQRIENTLAAHPEDAHRNG